MDKVVEATLPKGLPEGMNVDTARKAKEHMDKLVSLARKRKVGQIDQSHEQEAQRNIFGCLDRLGSTEGPIVVFPSSLDALEHLTVLFRLPVFTTTYPRTLTFHPSVS